MRKEHLAMALEAADLTAVSENTRSLIYKAVAALTPKNPDTAQSELTALKAELASDEQDHAELRDVVAKLREELETSRVAHHETAKVANALREENERLKSESFEGLYNEAIGERDALREELAGLQHWRDLALQFDHHRIETLWHLKALVVRPSHKEAAEVFLSNPPLAAHEVVQRLTAAEQRNAELVELIQKAHTWVDRNNCGGWDAYELRDQLAAALKPTESGASE